MKSNDIFFFIQSYFYNDDNFNFNYAQAKATAGNFKESEEVSVATPLVFMPNVATFKCRNRNIHSVRIFPRRWRCELVLPCSWYTYSIWQKECSPMPPCFILGYFITLLCENLGTCTWYTILITWYSLSHLINGWDLKAHLFQIFEGNQRIPPFLNGFAE